VTTSLPLRDKIALTVMGTSLKAPKPETPNVRRP